MVLFWEEWYSTQNFSLAIFFQTFVYVYQLCLYCTGSLYIVQHPGSLNIYFLSACLVPLFSPSESPQTNNQNAKWCMFFFYCFFHKKTGISHKATKFSNSKAIFLHVKVYNFFFLTGRDRVNGVFFCIATIPMACLGLKLLIKHAI